MVTPLLRTCFAACAGLMLVSTNGSTVEALKPKSLCIFTTLDFGQKTNSVWCNADSCYLTQFSRNNPTPSPVGLYGIPVDKARRNQGDSLAIVFMKTKNWSAKPASSTLSVSLGGAPAFSVPRHPLNQKGLAGLNAWERSLKADLEGHPIWKDSLVLKRLTPGSNTISISLTSSGPTGRWMGSEGAAKVQTSSQKSGTGNGPSRSWDGQDTLTRGCTDRILAGKGCDYPLPKGVQSLKVILKSTPNGKSLGIPNTCLEGRFEWVAEWSE